MFIFVSFCLCFVFIHFYWLYLVLSNGLWWEAFLGLEPPWLQLFLFSILAKCYSVIGTEWNFIYFLYSDTMVTEYFVCFYIVESFVCFYVVESFVSSLMFNKLGLSPSKSPTLCTGSAQHLLRVRLNPLHMVWNLHGLPVGVILGVTPL